MRAIFLTILLILLKGCSSTVVVDQKSVSQGPAADGLSAPSSARNAADMPRPDSETNAVPQQNPPASSPAVPLEMSVPLVTWNNAERKFELQLVDPATGQVLPDRPPIEIGRSAAYSPTVTLSPDGGLLALVTGVGFAHEAYYGSQPAADEVRLIDLRTWREVSADIASQFAGVPSPLKGWVDPLVFTPDGARLALAYHNRDGTTAMLFDAQTGQLIGRQSLPIRPRLMEFSADGTQLVIYGSPLAEIPGISQPDPPSVLLLDARSLEIQWAQVLPDILEGSWCLENCGSDSEATLGAYWWPAVVFSPERQELYIVHADADRLTTVNFQDHSVRGLMIGPRPTWIERLLALTAYVAEAKGWPEGSTRSAVLSPDGARLYLIGQTWDRSKDANGEWHGRETSLGLRVIDVAKGHELDAYDMQADWISTTPDRQYLLLRTGWQGLIEIRDADTLDMVGSIEGWELQLGRRVDGQPVILLRNRASDTLSFPTRLAILQLEPFGLLTPWSVKTLALWVPAP